MSDLGFSLLQNGNMGFSSATDFDKAKNYTDKEITIKSISANGSAIVPDENKNVNIPLANDTFDGLVTAVEREKLQNLIGFDGTITSSLLSDKVNCPRTIGVFKVLKSDGNTYGILISTAVGKETDARFQLYILPSSIGTAQIRWRKYDTTANEWSDWDIQRPRLITTDPIATPVSLNTVYAINQTGTSSAVIVRLPEGKVGDFVQYDFVTGSTAPTVTIESVYGMTEFDFTPEANKIYSLFFDWGMIAASDTGNTYGWRISFAEYDYTATTTTTETETGEITSEEDL